MTPIARAARDRRSARLPAARIRIVTDESRPRERGAYMEDVIKNLGPLARLAGIWEGEKGDAALPPRVFVLANPGLLLVPL